MSQRGDRLYRHGEQVWAERAPVVEAVTSSRVGTRPPHLPRRRPDSGRARHPGAQPPLGVLALVEKNRTHLRLPRRARCQRARAEPRARRGEIGHPSTMARGKLRIYLGAAPGVGKTYAMLDEGWRRRARRRRRHRLRRHPRPRKTIASRSDLEIVRATVEYRGAGWDEIDVDAILARRPEVVLVDELAHTNVPGSATRSAGRTSRRCSPPGSR